MKKGNLGFQSLKYKGKNVVSGKTTNTAGILYVYDPQGLKKLLLQVWFKLRGKEYPYGFKRMSWYGFEPQRKR